ncbi:outer membrane protein [Aurantimonas manganoxydans]|nr:outer membrane protein [Aurantimonas manganoxydans]
MKSRLLTTVALIGAVSSFSSFAKAADIIEEQPYFPPPAPVIVEEVATGGWYLRGDVGYVFKSKTDGYYDFYNIGNTSPEAYDDDWVRGIDSTEHYDEISLKNSANFSIGAGYRVSDHFRTDLTVDYMRTGVSGSSKCAYLVEIGYGLDPTNNNCRYDDSSRASIWTTMANAYVDVGTYGKITPYIGAGLGFAHVKYDDMNNTISCDGGLCGSETSIYKGVHKGESSWRFASSLMAGASVDITHKLKFDAGYRYTRISSGDAFAFDEQDRSFGASGVQGSDNGFNIHAVRAGLRYEFGGGGGGFGKGKGKGVEPIYASTPLYEEPAPIYEEPIYK